MSRTPEARPFGAAAGRHPSPFRLDLEQQRKRAKELLKGLRAREPEALGRFRRHHPQGPGLGEAALPERPLKLSAAHLVIARELGLPSWPRLKAHIEAMDRNWQRIASGDGAPDRDMATLHIRCGEDIAGTLREAGFAGDFLEYSDPFCQGPVLDAPDWLRRRAAFLAASYGTAGEEEIAAGLARAEERLAEAAAGYERVVLWFEHDTYDQLILARCLARFAEAAPKRLELISPGRFPGGMRFIGLGQLPPEALRLLWAERTEVPPGALEAGRRVWDLLRAPDPRPLAALAAAGTPDLPQLGRAVRRHCQELPWTGTGLGLTERLVLEILAEGPLTVGRIYARLMTDREPLPWLTDLMILAIVESMKKTAEPVFTGAFDGEDRSWPKERLTVTPLGRAVLAGEVDWLSLGPPPRWLGGVLVAGPAPSWRWDEATGRVVAG